MLSPRLGAVVGALLCVLATACAEPSANTGTAPSTSSATPSPTVSPGIDPVDAALAALGRREQVAQLIIVGVALTDLSPADGLATQTARWAESSPGRIRGSASIRTAVRAAGLPPGRSGNQLDDVRAPQPPGSHTGAGRRWSQGAGGPVHFAPAVTR